MAKNKLLRMDNLGIVVESLDDTISFFTEIGLKLEGRATVEGEWAGRVTGLDSQYVEIAMGKRWTSNRLGGLRTPILIGLTLFAFGFSGLFTAGMHTSF
ncbi:Glyoxalase [Pedobacter cryoconitis]|uniref:Glyoxalase n=1 Tax=Pedobacter cryoconitis TaxID=188932 RepID=A0A127VBN7_9SPHI|nr:hypothetical protein [Pedobacter cryoconitis]AMP98766.1 Glyoxalase [Pedobacter cryoconitis]